MFGVFLVAASVARAQQPDTCETCLLAGLTWQPADGGKCTSDCAIQDISCFTPAIGCPGGCDSCLKSGKSWHPDAAEENKCTDTCSHEENCLRPGMECPAPQCDEENQDASARELCCKETGFGCEEFDCRSKELWSPEKQKWCCEQTGFGCKTGPIRVSKKACMDAQDLFKATLEQRVSGFLGFENNYTIWCAGQDLEDANYMIAPSIKSIIAQAAELGLAEALSSAVAPLLNNTRPELLNKSLSEVLVSANITELLFVTLRDALTGTFAEEVLTAVPEVADFTLAQILNNFLADALANPGPEELESTVPRSLLRTFFNNKRGINMLLNYDMWQQECAALTESECRSAMSHAPCVWISNAFNVGGKCEVSDQTCVENQDEDACLEKAGCRWVPHNDLEEVSFVPCRPIRTNDQLCDVYQNWQHCSGNDICKWNVTSLKCQFNGCDAEKPVDQSCACSIGSADPRDPAPVCHYGHKCHLPTANADGPYALVEGTCETTTTLVPEENTCAHFWISSCKEGANDGTDGWRPVYDEWKTKQPDTKPEETCCKKTCSVWAASGNSCGSNMLRPNMLCGDEGCSEAKCCRPTCANFQCDANKPENLQDGSVLKSNAQAIACKDKDGEENCTFTQCCEITCLSKKGICDVLGLGGRKERLKQNAGSLLCSDNTITDIQIDIAITADKCDHNFCCDLEYGTCAEAKANNDSVCGKGEFIDWADKTEETPCGPSDNYQCNVGEHCCVRTCEAYLGFGDRHCPVNHVMVKPTFECNNNCNTETCCAPTCASFECTEGMIPIDSPGSYICGETGCNASTCCIETCLTQQLRHPAGGFCPAGKVFRGNLTNLLCGSDGSKCLENDKELCCQPTCEHYTTHIGCAEHYIVNQENQNVTCGGPDGTSACSKDLCCTPTCNHYLKPVDSCLIKDFNGHDTGFSAKPDIGTYTCSGNECTHGECCQRTCGQYLSSASVGGCENGMIPNTDNSSAVCDEACSQEQCCLETCASWNDCPQDSGLKPSVSSVACTTFGGSGCTAAKCCQANCAPFSNCDAGFVKKESADTIICTGPAGTIADCDSNTCCRPTCASFECPSNFQPKENTGHICNDEICTTSQCCDTTCASWTADVAGTCSKNYVLVSNPNTILCDYASDNIYDAGSECQNICCKETCASFLAETNAGSLNGTCGIDGLSTPKNMDRQCDESSTGSCSIDFCCEYTCAKFAIASCVGRGLTYRKENKHLGCSKNPRPVDKINQTYTAEVEQNGQLILKHLYPCDRVFCCATECQKVPSCPVNEQRISSSECKDLTTCNLHKCCKCGAGASCHPDPDGDEKTKRCVNDVYGQSKKCVHLDQCVPANDKLDAVPHACYCHTAAELAANENNPIEKPLTDVCTDYFSEVCRVTNLPGKRCTPKCKEGGNKNTCVCGSTICEANGYCQSGQCQACVGFNQEQCSTVSDFCWWGEIGTETLPKSGCIAIRLTPGQALIGRTGQASSGFSVGETIGIAAGTVAILTAGAFAANYMRNRKSEQDMDDDQ